MNKRTKTWISIAVAVLIVVVMLGIAAIGGTAYFLSSHVRQSAIDEAQASERFAQARQQLGSRPALLEVDDRDDVVIHRGEAAAGPVGAKLKALRALVYDVREGRIVDVDIPFWFVRMMPSGQMSFIDDNGIRFDSDRVRVTVEDIERHGAGLILDHRDRTGARVLVWTE